MDMKSCLITSMDRILRQSEDCSFLTCISAAGHVIHSGIFMCPAGHPLLHGAIHKVLETPLSSPGFRLSAYMTVCQHMWDMLTIQTGGHLTAGKNLTSVWGFVWLMTERKKSKGTIVTQGQSIQIDGHVATLQVANVPVVENGCELWSRGLKRVRDTPHVDVMADLNASAVVNDSDPGVLETVPSTNEALVALAMQRFPHHYRSLTPDELPDFALQGLIATDALRLGSLRHRRQARAQTAATAMCLDDLCV